MERCTLENPKLIQSCVVNKYFVSTALRESSALEGPREYFETIIWEWDVTTRLTGNMLQQLDSGLTEQGALGNHYNHIRLLLENTAG